MPEGVMPIQRLGLKQGEGAAQVFSFPEVSRDLEYMRARKAQDRQNELLQKREDEKRWQKIIDDQLNRLDDSPLWHTNDKYFNEVTGLVDDAKNNLIDNMGKIADGDTQALREAMQKVSYARNRADQVGVYKKESIDALGLMKQNLPKYSPEKRQTIIDFNEGKIDYDDLPDNWNWYDVEDIEPLFSKFEDLLSGSIQQKVSDATTIRPGLVGIDFEQDLGGAMAEAERLLGSDPMAIADIASHYQTDKNTAKGYFLDDLEMRLAEQKESVFRSHPVRTGSGKGREEEEDNIFADTLVADSERAAAAKDPEFLQKYVAGSGYNVDWSDGNFTFTPTKVSASGYRDEAIVIPDDETDGIVRTVTDLVKLNPESVRKGQPANREQVAQMKQRVDAVVEEINAIPAESGWSEVSTEGLNMLNTLKGVEIEQMGALWWEGLTIKIDGESYNMQDPDRRSQATKLLRRKAVNTSSFQDTATPRANPTSPAPAIINDPSQLPD